METIWHYLVNQFLNVTKENYKKMLKLSNYHDAYLKKMMDQNPMEPDLALLYNRYHPFHEAFFAAYTAWKAAGGTQKGQTLTLDQLLVLLITKANKWDSLVQAVDGFEKGTGNYLTLFPQGHYPFNTGATTARVAAVKTLSNNLDPFSLTNPAILMVKGLVDAFYTQLDGVRDNQEGSKGGTQQKSAEVETKRIVVATEQYRDLGFLINKGAEVPSYITPFFELKVLRSHEQVHFTGTLDAGENEAVLEHTFVDDDELVLEITTTETVPASTQAVFYLATTPNGTDSTPVTVKANAAKIKVLASEFGAIDFATHRFLTAVNSTTFELHYVVELL